MDSTRIEIFPWNSGLLGGIQTIDDQHKQLVTMINDLAAEIIREDSKENVLQTFSALSNYAAYHFEEEESIWEEYFDCSEQCESHEYTHKVFKENISKAQDMLLKAADDDYLKLAEKMLFFLCDWLAGHIIRDDLIMCTAVKLVQEGLDTETAFARAVTTSEQRVSSLMHSVVKSYREIATLNYRLVQQIQEQKGIESQLRDSENRLSSIISNEPECIKIVETDGSLLMMNPAGLGMIEADSEASVCGHSVYDLIDIADRDAFKQMHLKVINGETCTLRFKIRGLKGTVRWVESHATALPYNGRFRHLAVTRDITEQVINEEKLSLAASVFTHAEEAIVLLDSARNIINVNEAFTTITGYTKSEVIGRDLRFLNSKERSHEEYLNTLNKLLTQGVVTEVISRLRRNGTAFIAQATEIAVRDEAGNLTHYIELFSDQTELVEQKKNLERMAHYDPLTGLLNKAYFSLELNRFLKDNPHEQGTYKLISIDLDNFKEINDALGNEGGNKVLKKIADRIKSACDETALVARFGGDDFFILCQSTHDHPHDACVLDLLGAIRKPVMVNHTTVSTSACIGIVELEGNQLALDGEQLIRQADQAMFHAKLQGAGNSHVFDPKKDESKRRMHQTISYIKRAIDQDELILYYQPKVNFQSKKLEGVEALVRWDCPDRGIVPPNDFLPLIEQHPSTAIELDNWVLRAALRQASDWLALGYKIPISINLFPQHLQRTDLFSIIRKIIQEFPEVPTNLIDFEILESSSLDVTQEIVREMQGMTNFGVSFSIDDFGTGYSSLMYLSALPIQTLKIDQSFIRTDLNNSKKLNLVKGIIQFAKSLELKIVAEGVEDPVTFEILRSLGCDIAQGFGIAKPLPSKEFITWWEHWQQQTGI